MTRAKARGSLKTAFILSIAYLALLLHGQGCTVPSEGPPSPPPGQQSNRVSEPQPTGPTGNFRIIFSDDFSYSPVDTSKWNLTWPWATPLNNGLQNYEPGNSQINNGQLHLIAENRSSGGQPYTSGAVSTYQKFTFTYGVVESRLKMPAGKGFWSAVWMVLPTGVWPPEIDLIELLGPQPTVPFMTYHCCWTGPSSIQSINIPSIMSPAPNLSNDFHTFTVDWSPTEITWYIDGLRQGGVTSSQTTIASEPMILLFNLGVGGNAGGFGPGTPDGSTVFPSEMVIDYVRVWERQ